MVLDASVLLGPRRTFLIAGAFLRYYDAFWSTGIVAEFVRKRTEWVGQRAVREGCDVDELRHRLLQSRERVNALVAELSGVFRSVDYTRAPELDLNWLADPDDRPVVQTAYAARAHALVSDDNDLPVGLQPRRLTIVRSGAFLDQLAAQYPQMWSDVRRYLNR